MPAAIVLSLRAEQDGAIYGATGQHVHGFWLNVWRRVEPETGDALHDETQLLRPFALSPLMGLPRPLRGRTRIMAEATAWLRVAALDDATQARLLEAWLPGAPRRINLGGQYWRLERITASPEEHPAAGWERFVTLRDRYADGEPPRRWTLSFETPMALHQRDGSYLPFPLPAQLVLGWLDRWRECSDLALPEMSFERLSSGLRISGYELKTVAARHWRREAGGRRREWPQIGCVGVVTIDGSQLAAAERAAVSSLVDFAFYCGSGHHTTMGMGMTRIVEDDS